MQTLKLLSGCFLAAFLFTCLGSAQTISIVSGNGQLVCPDCPLDPQQYAPLVVQVNDTSGKPLANTTVTFTATQGTQTPVVNKLQTSSTGQISYTFVPSSFFFGSNLLQGTIVASLGTGGSVTFYETTALPVQGAAPVQIQLGGGVSAQHLTGAAGSTSKTAITVVAYQEGFFAPLPNIQVRLQSGVAGPTVSCQTQVGQQAGTVLTDATGTATCYPVFGGILGTGTYTIFVGDNYANFGATPLTVTQGTAALLKYISGSPQTTNANVIANQPLVVQATDMGGNPVNGAVVTWAVKPGSGAASLSATSTTTSLNGEASIRVTPSSGPVTVLATLAVVPTQQVPFTINVTTIITGLTASSGSGQSAKLGLPFAQPLIVLVNDNAAGVSGATVSFTATGPIILSSPTAVSDTNGLAQVTVTAGDTTGTATITASITSAGKTYTAPFTLFVIPNGPVISMIQNAAGFQNQFVSPCSLAYITGTGFADDIQGVVQAFIEAQTIVDGVTVQFNPPNGPYAPILDIANENGQESLGVQIPCELQASTMPITVPMVVTAGGASSDPFQVTISTYSPGIFEAVDPTDGVTRAVMLRSDGSFVSVKNPALRGETVRMFVTGMGQTNPPLFTNELDPTTPGADGVLIPQFPTILAPFTVGVNNGGNTVVSATYAYGMVGVYQIDFVLPATTTAGNSQPLAMFVVQNNKAVFANSTLIPIQ